MKNDDAWWMRLTPADLAVIDLAAWVAFIWIVRFF